MTNDYEERGEVTVIFAKGKHDGKMYEILVDTADMYRVAAVPATWWVATSKKKNNGRRVRLYAECVVCCGKRREYFLMHRAILLPDDDQLVDHRDGDGLNNRRFNLRIVGWEINSLNRHAASPHSRTGIRGVGVYHGKNGDRYSAQVTAFGERNWLGVYSTAEEAQTVVQDFLKDIGV